MATLAHRDLNRVATVGVGGVGVEVDLNEELHQYRHASELTKESKGGYLNGSVRILDFPEGAQIRSIILDLVRHWYRFLAYIELSGGGAAKAYFLVLTLSVRCLSEVLLKNVITL